MKKNPHKLLLSIWGILILACGVLFTGYFIFQRIDHAVCMARLKDAYHLDTPQEIDDFIFSKINREIMPGMEQSQVEMLFQQTGSTTFMREYTMDDGTYGVLATIQNCVLYENNFSFRLIFRDDGKLEHLLKHIDD